VLPGSGGQIVPAAAAEVAASLAPFKGDADDTGDAAKAAA
jgi:hypothetical protein